MRKLDPQGCAVIRNGSQKSLNRMPVGPMHRYLLGVSQRDGRFCPVWQNPLEFEDARRSAVEDFSCPAPSP